jgi:hypothetical protein
MVRDEVVANVATPADVDGELGDLLGLQLREKRKIFGKPCNVPPPVAIYSVNTMKSNSIETLESRIAPATVTIDPIKLIATIDADAGGEDILILQGTDNLIDILDNNNGGASLTPSGGPEAIRGIIFNGRGGDDTTRTQLQSGNVNGSGFLAEPSLPEGFVINESSGTNTHTIEAVAEIVTIGKKFELYGGIGDDTFNLRNISRTKDFVCYGDTGVDALDIQDSSILGKVNFISLENVTSSGNRTLGPVTVQTLDNQDPTVIQLQADYFSGVVKYIGGTSDDTLTLTGTVGGAITFTGGDGLSDFSLTGTALKTIKFLGGSGDDSFSLSGAVLGAVTANMGDGANTVLIAASMAGKAISLIGGAGVDTFSVTAFNAGVLTAKLGGDADEINTLGVFKGLKLDAQDGGGVHNGAEKTLGKITRKNFI